MLNHSEHFEELCALAAGGQISEPEFEELQDHMRDCDRCRSAYADFIDLVHNKLPLVDLEPKSGWRPRIGYAQIVTLAAALLLVVSGVLGYALHRSSVAPAVVVAPAVLPPVAVVVPTTLPPVNLTYVAPAPVAPSSPGLARSVLPPVNLDESRVLTLQQQLQAAAAEIESLRSQQQQAGDSRTQLEKKLADAELAMTRTSDELQRIREGRAGDTATVAAQARQIRELSAKLSDQTETLDRETTLLAASRDIHDLMGARNLHIVDVLDVDSKGKDKRAFGRVFYTEEKSLIFYAFDLGDRGTVRRNASFQVWGARGPAQTAAKNLGIFYADDQKQNRWVLKFEDPRVLAEIDSVFVTVEPQGGSARPTGRKFLYAYLKANPNHP
jgi:hypothetical protein